MRHQRYRYRPRNIEQGVFHGLILWTRIRRLSRRGCELLDQNADKAPKGNDLRGNAAKDWQKLLIENGYTCRTIPKEYGGYGAEPDIVKSRIIAEEFSSARVNAGLGGQGISMLVPTLLEMGTQEQKEQFIRPTIHGDMVWCQGYSEPGAGSDLASLTTSAVLDGDEWVINGQKIWTSTAHIADWIFCLVRSEPDAPKHKGISFLLFDMKTPGIEVRPLVDMTGVANFNETLPMSECPSTKSLVSAARAGKSLTPSLATNAKPWRPPTLHRPESMR